MGVYMNLTVAPTAIKAVNEALEHNDRVGWKPALGLVLGTGLGKVAELVEDPIKLPFSKLWPEVTSKLEGHAKELILGDIGGLPVAVFSGRIHGYEGYEPNVVVQPVLLAQALAAESIVLTNAAGALNTDLAKGQILVLSDHINLTGRSPLKGPNNEALGTRFPGQGAIYGRHKDLTARVMSEFKATVLKSGQIEPRNGVYLGVNGPEFETPAEVKMMRGLGADVVGMSTVHEAITANWLGLGVIGLSLVTNATGTAHEEGEISHAEVQEAGREAGPRLVKFTKLLLEAYRKDVFKKS